MESENLLFKSLHSSSKIPETVSIPASIRIFLPFPFTLSWLSIAPITFLKPISFNFNEQAVFFTKCAQGSRKHKS